MIPNALIWVPTAVLTATFMELWAAVLHGRFWHGPLWFVHRSHHMPGRGLELNDVLSVLHAPIAAALIIWGCEAAPSILREVGFGVGTGMTVFGFAYVVVHDGLVHGRLPVAWLARIPYFERVRDAHWQHHRNTARGLPFGLFLGPWELARFRDRHAPHAPSRRTPTRRPIPVDSDGPPAAA